MISDDLTQSFSEPDCKIYPTVVRERHTYHHPFFAARHALVDNVIDAQHAQHANYWAGPQNGVWYRRDKMAHH